MTPQRIADISEPIEQLYSDLTDELLINIAKHLSRSTATWSALHEIETLEEMGQLTQENIEIINTYVAKMPQEIKDAMNESRKEALGEIESKLADAAAKGYLTTPVSDSTVDVVQAFSNQAAEQLNLVNQTMLNTSLQQYQSGIYEFRREMQNAAPKTIENEQELELAQQQIDLAAGKTVTGTETRYNAMRQAIRNLNKAGIVGYYDRANRAWTAEAYVNMDIRTTVHNTYIQSVQTRQQDYGSDVFQVSAHAGARPLCYPYQGKLYSWSGSGGYIRLGDGKQHRFEPIGSTSYGEPAGLFGINCGHVPYPMIPDVSEMVDEKIQSEEENTKQYQESQKQRALERQIRYAKRNVEMLGNLATDADRDKIKQAQANMRAFIQETGRTRRYDREQIVTQRGNTGTKPTARTPLTPSSTTINYVTTKTEAYNSLKKVFLDVEDKVLKLDESVLVENVNRFNELNERFQVVKLDTKSLLSVNNRKTAIAYVTGGYHYQSMELSLNQKYYKKREELIDSYYRGQKSGYKMPSSDDYKTTYTITHEYGHLLEAHISRNRTDFRELEEKAKTFNPALRYKVYNEQEEKEAKIILDEILDIAKSNNANFDLEKNLSGYGHTNVYEAFAEIFANSQCGKPNELGLAMQEWLTNEGY